MRISYAVALAALFFFISFNSLAAEKVDQTKFHELIELVSSSFSDIDGEKKFPI